MCTSIHKPKSSNCFTSDPWAKIITNQNKKSDLQYGAACFTIVNLSKHIIHLLYRVYYTEEENRFSENRRKKETSSRKLIPHASREVSLQVLDSHQQMLLFLYKLDRPYLQLTRAVALPHGHSFSYTSLAYFQLITFHMFLR